MAETLLLGPGPSGLQLIQVLPNMGSSPSFMEFHVELSIQHIASFIFFDVLGVPPFLDIPLGHMLQPCISSDAAFLSVVGYQVHTVRRVDSWILSVCQN